MRYPLAREGVYAPVGPAFLAHNKHKSQQCCGPNGSTASIFYGICIKQSRAMIFISNLDEVTLFPKMNRYNVKDINIDITKCA